eukprot:CAMPEP_0115890926 /NCGR_PEP_ID=MMETSP0287-20121206/33601_1 /TAXON_ID=412157 /ORGANISM="Chrysochromulina rotalis, Strain UIO044" /LENGTH=60 /DNA_ID=CAMNT_0003347709 /DNA_START=561 /DNA_END=743 /DNA_ORIENTATION=-
MTCQRALADTGIRGLEDCLSCVVTLADSMLAASRALRLGRRLDDSSLAGSATSSLPVDCD